MKKTPILLAALVLAFVLGGCGQDPAPPEPPAAEPRASEPLETFPMTQAREVRTSDAIPQLAGEGFQMETRETEQFSAAYYRLPHYATQVLSDKAFLICTDPVEMNQGSRYSVFVAEAGELREVENQELSKNFLLSGHPLYLECAYAEYAPGWTALTYVPPLDDQDFYYPHCAAAEGWLLGAPYLPENLMYPVGMDPKTGTVTDPFAAISWDVMETALPEHLGNNSLWSPEGRLLTETKQGHWGYFDALAGAFWDLDARVGAELAGCTATGDWSKLICWDEEGNVWQVPTHTLVPRQVLWEADLAFRPYRGYASFLVEWLPEGTYLVHDFLTGERTPIPDGKWDLYWAMNGHPVVSPDGRKLLLSNDDAGAWFAVWDCDSKTFTILDYDAGEIPIEYLEWTPDGRIALYPEDRDRFAIYTESQ